MRLIVPRGYKMAGWTETGRKYIIASSPTSNDLTEVTFEMSNMNWLMVGE